MEKGIKVVNRTIPTSFLDAEIAEVFVAEENVDSTEGPKWFEPMWDYLAKGVFPQDKNEARNLIRQAHRYAILANRLYRRSFFEVLMRCVSKRQGEKIMREANGGDFGEDQSQGRMAIKRK
uniref:Orf120a n=1 Tax=Batis maritima TaxID=4436 RepID=A0A068BE29_BATMA|nr:orf120a [Batis maritima]AIC83326.1 orf120a [Batis maritima]